MTHLASSSDVIKQRLRIAALRQANDVRLARADMKRRIARRELTAAEILLKPSSETETWRLESMLISQPNWGPDRTRRFLRAHRLAERTRIGALTEASRIELATDLSRGRRGIR